MTEINSTQDMAKAMEFMREHPGERIPYISEEENDKCDKYVAAKKDANYELANKLEKEISSTPCWFSIDMYAELDEKRRKKYNEGKPTLVQTFNDWADGKIDDETAKKQYEQLELYKVKYDETDKYTNDGPINFVGDDNSLFELNYEIRERFGTHDEGDMGVKFKRAIGMIADPSKSGEEAVDLGEIPFGGESELGSDKQAFEEIHCDPDYMPGDDDDSFYAPEPLKFDSGSSDEYSEADYEFEGNLRSRIELKVDSMLRERHIDICDFYDNGLDMVLDSLSNMALIIYKAAENSSSINWDEVVKQGANAVITIMEIY